MDFIRVELHGEDSQVKEILIARLTEMGYLGFEETDDVLIAYISVSEFDHIALKGIAGTSLMSIAPVKEENWNAVWESNFEPVVIEDFCTIRAEFHEIEVRTLYDIIITPKMSFGTGHHSTTRSVILLMSKISFINKRVMDFGTGTGILAILSSKLGASKVVAIDNDEWSFRNATENVSNNQCLNVEVSLTDLNEYWNDHFDVVLANINKNVLINYSNTLSHLVNNNGYLILSGILDIDESDIVTCFSGLGFEVNEIVTDSCWMAILLKKNVD